MLFAGVKVCNGDPSISHLLFADDSLILNHANEGDCMHLWNVLQLYEACSGQVINKAKSTILFTKNVDIDKKKTMCDFLQATKETMNERYLVCWCMLASQR